jgi:hypothetical protein
MAVNVRWLLADEDALGAPEALALAINATYEPGPQYAVSGAD